MLARWVRGLNWLYWLVICILFVLPVRLLPRRIRGLNWPPWLLVCLMLLWSWVVLLLFLALLRWWSSPTPFRFTLPSGGVEFEQAFWRAAELNPKSPEVLSLAREYLDVMGGSAWMFCRKQVDYAADAGIPLARVKDLGGGVKMRTILIPPGEFMMGSPSSESGRYSDEGPVHKVRITKPFYMGVYEVTQAQYRKVRYRNPSYFSFWGNDRPVERVSWNDAVEFCKKLSEKEGGQYRLPTEAEWEYTCRAGTWTRFYSGDGDSDLEKIAWHGCNVWHIWKYSGTTGVGGKLPNAFGLYDMSGNLLEWCQSLCKSYPYRENDGREDLTAGGSRVLRGGSWHYYAGYCRSAYRSYRAPTHASTSHGFRVVVRRLAQE